MSTVRKISVVAKLAKSFGGRANPEGSATFATAKTRQLFLERISRTVLSHNKKAPTVPAGEIERFVVDQIECIGGDPTVIKETLAQARIQAQAQIERLREERGELPGRLRHAHTELGQMAVAHPRDPQIADAHDRIRDAERRLTQVEDELVLLDRDLVDKSELATALAEFDALWDSLAPREQARVIELLVERIEYDGEGGNISMTFRASGIPAFAAQPGSMEGGRSMITIQRNMHLRPSRRARTELREGEAKPPSIPRRAIPQPPERRSLAANCHIPPPSRPRVAPSPSHTGNRPSAVHPSTGF